MPTYPYLQPGTGRRIFQTNPFAVGMFYSDNPLKEGVSRVLSNLDITATNSAVKIRPSIFNGPLVEQVSDGEGNVTNQNLESKAVLRHVTHSGRMHLFAFSNTVPEHEFIKDYVFQDPNTLEKLGVRTLRPSSEINKNGKTMVREIPLFEHVIWSEAKLNYTDRAISVVDSEDIAFSLDEPTKAIQILENLDQDLERDFIRIQKSYPHVSNPNLNSFAVIGRIVHVVEGVRVVYYKGLLHFIYNENINKYLLEITRPKTIDVDLSTVQGVNLLNKRLNIFNQYIGPDYYNYYASITPGDEGRAPHQVLGVIPYNVNVRDEHFDGDYKVITGVDWENWIDTVFVKPYLAVPQTKEKQYGTDFRRHNYFIRYSYKDSLGEDVNFQPTREQRITRPIFIESTETQSRRILRTIGAISSDPTITPSHSESSGNTLVFEFDIGDFQQGILKVKLKHSGLRGIYSSVTQSYNFSSLVPSVETLELDINVTASTSFNNERGQIVPELNLDIPRGFPTWYNSEQISVFGDSADLKIETKLYLNRDSDIQKGRLWIELKNTKTSLPSQYMVIQTLDVEITPLERVGTEGTIQSVIRNPEFMLYPIDADDDKVQDFQLQLTKNLFVGGRRPPQLQIKVELIPATLIKNNFEGPEEPEYMYILQEHLVATGFTAVINQFEDRHISDSEILDSINIRNATRLAIWGGHYILYGEHIGANSLFFSAFNDPSYFPFAFNAIDFENQIIHVHTQRGFIYVFHTGGITMLHSGIAPNELIPTNIYDKMAIRPSERESVVALGKDVFFIADRAGYLLRQNARVEDHTDVYVKKISQAIDGIMYNPLDHAILRWNRTHEDVLDKDLSLPPYKFMEHPEGYQGPGIPSWEYGYVDPSLTVIDGDTIRLTNFEPNITCRLAFFDAPEMHEPFGYVAKAYLEYWLSQVPSGSLVIVNLQDGEDRLVDQYGRELVILIDESNNRVFNFDIIHQGLAKSLTSFGNERGQFSYQGIDLMDYMEHAHAFAQKYFLGVHGNFVDPWFTQDFQDALAQNGNDGVTLLTTEFYFEGNALAYGSHTLLNPFDIFPYTSFFVASYNNKINIIHSLRIYKNKFITFMYRYDFDRQLWNMYEFPFGAFPIDTFASDSEVGFSILAGNNQNFKQPISIASFLRTTRFVAFNKDKHEVGDYVGIRFDENLNILPEVEKELIPIYAYLDSGPLDLNVYHLKRFFEAQVLFHCSGAFELFMSFLLDGLDIYKPEALQLEIDKGYHSIPPATMLNFWLLDLSKFPPQEKQKVVSPLRFQGRVPSLQLDIKTHNQLELYGFSLVFKLKGAK